MALTDNPMSLVVTGNVTVGATLEASVPTTETRLLSTIDVNTTVTITVPAGVRVLKVTGDVYHEHEGEVALDVYSVNSKKPNFCWASSSPSTRIAKASQVQEFGAEKSLQAGASAIS